MFVYKAVVVAVSLCVLSFSTVTHAQVLSFKEWKDSRVQTSAKKVNKLRLQVGGKRAVRRLTTQDPNLQMKSKLEAASTADGNAENLESELKNEIYNLEMAHDLSVTDYFVGYLTKVPNRQAAFNEVAAKLSPEEISELMGAYANSIIGKSIANDASAQMSSNIEK